MVVARLALPVIAVHVPLENWAPTDIYRDFMKPAAAADGTPGRKFFNASPREWRWALRRTARCGLIELTDVAAVHPALTAGAFAVPKDALQDRLTGDRRPLDGWS